MSAPDVAVILIAAGIGLVLVAGEAPRLGRALPLAVASAAALGASMALLGEWPGAVLLWAAGAGTAAWWALSGLKARR